MSFTEGFHRRVNEFNPFSYFVEAEGLEVESIIYEIFSYESLVLLILLLILAIKGYVSLTNTDGRYRVI